MTKTCGVCGREFNASATITRFCSRPCGYRGRVVGSIGQRVNFRGTFNERLDRYTVRGDGCWEWIGSKSGPGYGKIQLPGKPYREVPAHRAMYERYVGPIPAGLDLDHLCRVRHCVRPDHLEPVTRKENLRRGAGPTGILYRKGAA